MMSTARTGTDRDTDTDVDRTPRDVDVDRDADEADDRAERRTVATRQAETHPAGERASLALASVAHTVGRLIRLAAVVIAAIIAVGILFIVLEANPSNDIVSTVNDVARDLVGPFDDMFSIDNAKVAVAVNWGIAAFVYLIVGALIAWLIEWIGTAGLRFRRA
jgi:hypothetical protein